MSNEDILGPCPKQSKLPFVWELDYNGIKSYLVGTNHRAPNCFKDDIEERLKRASQLVVECEVFSMKEEYAKAKEKLNARASCESIVDMLDEDEQQELAKIAQLPGYIVKKMLSGGRVPSLLQANVPPYFKGVDQVFYDAADARKMPVYGLETINEHAGAAENAVLTKEDCVNELKKIILRNRKYGSLRRWIEKIGEAYVAADADKVGEFLFGDSLLPSEVRLVVGRNERLTERSIQYLQTPSVVAVGIGHLIIEPSMLRLYEQKGIKVKRVD